MTDEFDYSDLDALPILRRRIAWDLLPCEDVAEYLPALGLIPSSEDGSAMDHEDSHERMDRCAPLVPAIEVYATLVADIMGTVMLHGKKDSVDEETCDLFNRQNLMILRNGVYAVIAQLLDNGYMVIAGE